MNSSRPLEYESTLVAEWTILDLEECARPARSELAVLAHLFDFLKRKLAKEEGLLQKRLLQTLMCAFDGRNTTCTSRDAAISDRRWDLT
jgi:hypothetical protein